MFNKIREYQQNNERESVVCRLVQGDTIECLAYNPNDALRIALTIKAGVKSFPLDDLTNRHRKLFEDYGARVAIGIGNMEMNLLDKDIWKGDAINLSGRLIANQKTSNKERVAEKNTLFFGSYDKEMTQVIQTIMLLLDAIFSKMTRKQCEIVFWKLIGYNEQEIADELAISQSSVNQRSSAAGWASIENTIDLFERLELRHSQMTSIFI
jgi:predicted DNA-binding protein YlxM (UPF0122 family)